ncbi:pilin [Francisella philomiragia]|uniref:pilin n=1 Tax=Francisella philomiragia TaxID=28110 RepID=UPI0035171A5E
MKHHQINKTIGFSLVELMVTIAIIAILAAIAIPMYSNYTIRTKLGVELTKLGSAKADANDYIISNTGNTNYSPNDLPNLPSGASVNNGVSNGRIDIDTSSIISGSKITLTPTVGSSAIVWSCTIEGVDQSQAPTNCLIV